MARISKRLKEALKTRPTDLAGDLGELRLGPKRLAFHEASHAVIDVVLGIRFTWVVATRRGGWVDASNPCVGWQPGDGSRARLARHWAVSMYAGAAGEDVLGEGVAPWYRDFDSAEDWLNQVALPRGATHVGDEACQAQVERLRKRSKGLVQRHWSQIETTAQALLNLQALEEDEVKVIVGGGEPPRR